MQQQQSSEKLGCDQTLIWYCSRAEGLARIQTFGSSLHNQQQQAAGGGAGGSSTGAGSNRAEEKASQAGAKWVCVERRGECKPRCVDRRRRATRTRRRGRQHNFAMAKGAPGATRRLRHKCRHRRDAARRPVPFPAGSLSRIARGLSPEPRVLVVDPREGDTEAAPKAAHRRAARHRRGVEPPELSAGSVCISRVREAKATGGRE